MNSHSLRRVPWTCDWGRFGVAVEDLGAGRSRVDDVFWACRPPRARRVSGLPHVTSVSGARSGLRPPGSGWSVRVGESGTCRPSATLLTIERLPGDRHVGDVLISLCEVCDANPGDDGARVPRNARRNYVARLACARNNQPYIVPIHVDLEGEFLYGYATLGQKIEWMRQNPLVCLEIDELMTDGQWASVLVFGRYEELPHVPEYEGPRSVAERPLSEASRVVGARLGPARRA